MTILIKDFKYEQITSGGSTPATGASVSSSIVSADANSVGPNVYPNLTWRSVGDDGRLFTDWSAAPRGIYLYSESMVPQATIVEALFGITPTTTTIINGLPIVTATPDYNGRVNLLWQQLFYQGKDRLGATVYALAYGNLAFWYGDYGFGLYLFIGFTTMPTQSVAYAASNTGGSYLTAGDKSSTAGVDSLVSGSSSSSGTETMESGFGLNTDGELGREMVRYYDTSSGLPIASPGQGDSLTTFNPTSTPLPPFTIQIGTKIVTATIETTMPAQDATTSAAQDMYTQLLRSTNAGWNSWARTIDQLENGEFIEYTAATGVTAASLCVGPAGREGRLLESFSHALVSDSEGVKIYENGVLVKTLYSVQTVTTKLRIYRMPDNSIVYMAITGTNCQLYTSLLALPTKVTDLFVYGHLYTAGDKITSAVYRVGEVQYGSV